MTYFKDGPFFCRSQCHIHIHYRVQQHHHIEGNVIKRPVMYKFADNHYDDDDDVNNDDVEGEGYSDDYNLVAVE